MKYELETEEEEKQRYFKKYHQEAEGNDVEYNLSIDKNLWNGNKYITIKQIYGHEKKIQWSRKHMHMGLYVIVFNKCEVYLLHFFFHIYAFV